MSRESRAIQVCTLFPLLCLLMILLPSGCQRKVSNQYGDTLARDNTTADEVRATPIQKNATTDDVRATSTQQNEAKHEVRFISDSPSDASLNVYVNGKKVNYFSDSANSVRPLLGNNLKDGRYGFGDSGEIDNVLDADGIRFIYDSKDGQFRRILITSDAYYVEGGGRVGDSRVEVQSKYPAGFYPTIKGKTPKNAYFYLRLLEGEEAGVGFRFEFDDSDKVKLIALSWWAFVP